MMRLKLDSLEADLAPDFGGAIAAFRCDGKPIFRHPVAGAADAFGMGEFPMAPYVNRIAEGRFSWRGESITLPRNRGRHPHPLHGLSWRHGWQVEQLGEHAARMRLQCAASQDWPWNDVVMTRTVALTPGALEVAFSVTHDDARPMPASIGLHAYFPVEGARARFASEAMWLTTPTGVPTKAERTAEVDALAAGALVSDLHVDHCFTGWDGTGEIVWPDRAVRIETDPPQRFAQLYAARSESFFCLEPQSAMPDAVNHSPAEGGIVELSRGETLAFATRFVVTNA